MAFKNVFEPENNLIRITAFDRVYLDDIRTNSDEILQHPDFISGMDVIWDSADAKLYFSTSDLREVIRIMESRTVKRGSGYKVAIIAKKSVVFGMSRMLSAFSATGPFEAMVFRTIAEAEEWIKNTN